MTKYIWILSHALILASLLAGSHALLKWVSVQPNNGYIDMLFNHWKSPTAHREAETAKAHRG